MDSHTKNLFLSSLSPSSYDALAPHLISVELPLHMLLYEEQNTPRYAYLITFGLASVITPMSNGESVEVGFIGHEGIVGGLHLLGPASISTRCLMQLAGTGVRIPYAELQKAYNACDEIRERILEFVQQQAVVVSQIAGCNRLHSAEQRLVRWLLTAQDRTQSDDLRFTHQYLAEMIASQRTAVTVIAGELQERGLIRYGRGNVQILDRQGLENQACDCYAIIKRLYVNLYTREVPVAVTA